MVQGQSGQASVTSLASAISASPTNFTNGVILECISSAPVSIFVGFTSSVSTSTGFELPPGASIVLPIFDLSSVFVVSSSSATLTWIGLA